MSTFKTALTEMIPNLRAFARSLCGDRERADDLVQETLLKAWAARERFQEGTNLKAWLFTILRNHFYSEMRHGAWEVPDVDGAAAARLATPPEQHSRVELTDFRRAMLTLPADQREALILVGASGFSYEEAAAISGCAVGTIKSRVSRARKELARRLDGEIDQRRPLGRPGSNVASTVLEDMIQEAEALAGATP